MGFIFSKFSKLGGGAEPPSPNPSPSVAETNQLFEPTHSLWAGYATADYFDYIGADLLIIISDYFGTDLLPIISDYFYYFGADLLLIISV